MNSSFSGTLPLLQAVYTSERLFFQLHVRNVAEEIIETDFFELTLQQL